MVTTSWVAAHWLRFGSGLFPVPKGVPEAVLYYKLLPFIVGIWLVAFSSLGFYSRRHRTAFIEALDIIQACIFATAIFIGFTYFYEEYRYSRIVLFIFALIQPWAIMFGRSGIRKCLRLYRHNTTPRRTLILGASPILDEAIRVLPQLDLVASEICGVTLVPGSDHRASIEFCKSKNLVVFAEMPTDWPQFLAKYNIQSIIVAVPTSCQHQLDSHLDEISQQVTDIKLIPDVTRFARLGTSVEMIQGIPIIHTHDSPLVGLGGLAKRGLDLLLSLLGILMVLPLLILVAVIIKMTSPGPILYRQERLGVDGRPFFIWKFRSMPINTEGLSGPVFATKGDDRATPFGRILRRTSIDELPQLFQVIMGEMSLVGPRPERPHFVDDFRRRHPGYMLRHKVRAGLTGWAQVNGWRGDTSIEKRMEFDLFYIQNWSFWLDIRIILRTFLKVIWDRNAY